MNLATTNPTPRQPLLQGYRPPVGVHDEMLAPEGLLRPHWQTLVGALDQLGREDFAARWDGARSILREHGVTYNVYGDAQGLDRPWALDLVPLVIPAEEWRTIETGLAQRARLLNAILADAYGPRRLVSDQLLPAPLLQANPGFLRSACGVRPPRGVHLFLHAVDLARSPNGQWWVLADRTQSPSGAGYALENRLVSLRVLGDEFRDANVHRLARFFRVMRDTLRLLAAPARGQPNVVLLTPGPYNETYFEQAFLARYLGFPLVEGGDLTVRNRRVFIKTLEGLQAVDVILRRVDDTFCDPLELRSDSHLGVPGLLDAARAGNVVVANSLGSGLVEMPALMAFLPGLCRHVLGEELKLPSVATWWCGQEQEREHVREHLADLVVKRAFATAGAQPVFGDRLTADEQAGLLASIGAEAHEYVGQEQVALSTVPVWEAGRLEPRPMVLRAYVAATGEGWCVMPGGLTRFSASPDRLVVSMQSGGGSKDTWVLADGPVPDVSLLGEAAQVVRLERAAAEVPSRVADNLYWLGRYVERLEDTVRVLRCLLGRLNGEAGAEETPELRAAVRLLVALEIFPPKFLTRYTPGGVEREAFLLIYQAHRLGTVREVLGRLKGIAFVLRDRFSADTWRIIGKLQVDAQARPGRLPATEALALLNTLVVNLAAFSGMEMENMTRGHGWRFLDIGRRLERAANVATLVQGGLAVSRDGLNALDPVLEIADSVMTYRRRYFAQPQWPPVADLLLADETNPRSLAFQLRALCDHTANLPRDTAEGGSGKEARLAAELLALVETANPPALAETELSGCSKDLSDLLSRLTRGLRGLSDGVTHRYFAHADTRAS
jgi:uncharacterized circularly permuted ATP-grasp superfamily protein/uncharacterized alpha-E superfamily protein